MVSAAGFLIMFRRNLELQKMEEQKKEEIHQTQLQFFTNISHEFRTPLTLIMGLSENSSEQSGLDYASIERKTQNPKLSAIHRNATKLLNLVNELMDFRKSESGALTLKVSETNLNAFLEEIAEEFAELALQRNMTFNISMQPKHFETWFDAQILEKIITNLVANAFKYTPDGGIISIETFGQWDISKTHFENELVIKNDYKAENYIFISVADTGIGISKESMPRLFERYFRISETHLGSGIGLAFVKSLTILHKGSIYVYSERHKGTEVIIAIPCSKNDYKSDERRAAILGDFDNNAMLGGSKQEQLNTISITTNDKKLTTLSNVEQPAVPINKNGTTPLILIVEDNIELLSFLKETLETHYNILEATNGKIGFEMAKETSPDLIISDIMMPVMNGLEFCKLVKSDIYTSHIPFIILTAKNALISKIEGTGIGADYYFTKPLSIELLLLTLKNIFIQKQKTKERYRFDYQSEAKDLVHSSKDKTFLEEFIHIVESNLTDSEMNIDYLCTQVGMSRTKLYTKIKSITGQSIGDFIRTIRLRKAAYLMTHEDKTLSEIMYSVGIQTQSYFTKAFKNEFGKTPTQFLKDLKK